MIEFKAVLLFKWPIFSNSLFLPSPHCYLLSLPRSLHAQLRLQQGEFGDILDPMLLGLTGCCKKQVARTVTQRKKGRIWQQMWVKRNDLILIYIHSEHNPL